MGQKRVIFAPQETRLPATQVEAVPLWQEEEETARDLKSPGDRLTCSGRAPFLYAASLHNNRDGIRIIQASSNEGDLVLDAYCGCGTAIVVAEQLKRNWIGIDITYQSISLVLRRLEGELGKETLANIVLNGIPQDMNSAHALALKQDDRVRKEFEKWAILTYTNNRAIINDKKGGDKGIDGMAFFLRRKDENAKIVFQVKSGNVGRGDVSKLNNDRTREGAELAVFLTLQPPTQGMKGEASAAGSYEHELMNRSYPRIQIVTVAEIVEQHKRLDIPMSLEVLKKAQAAALPNTLQPDLGMAF